MSHKIIQKGLAFRHEGSATTWANAFALLGILPRRPSCQCGASVMTGRGAVITDRRIQRDIEMEMQILILTVPRGVKGGSIL
jgi:hypothetical protein